MSSLLSVDRELGRLLSQAAVEGQSGVITGIRGKLKRLFCLVEGHLAYAISNVVEEQIGEQIVRSGLLAPSDLAAAQLAWAKRQKSKFTRFLVESGAIATDRLETAIEEHVRQLLFQTLDWTDGQCSFERGRPDLDGELSIRVSSVALLLEYAGSRPASLDMTRMRIGPPNVQPVPSLFSEAILADMRPDPTTLFVLGQSDGSRTLGQLIEESPAEPGVTWRAIYALVLAGALVPRGSRQEAASAAGTVSRDELVARLERAEGANHYGVLELTPTAKVDEIRDAYYFLARRYHPDRFRAGGLQDLMGKIEAYFAQVTEAHNTLSDKLARTEYDAGLAASKTPKKAEQDTRDLANQNFTRALALIKLRRFNDAVTSLENAIQLDANQARFYLELGRLQATNPRHRAEAENNLIHANKIDPALAEGYFSLGDLYARTNREEEAARLFREVLRWEPDHVKAAEQLADLGEPSKTDGGGRRGLFRG